MLLCDGALRVRTRLPLSWHSTVSTTSQRGGWLLDDRVEGPSDDVFSFVAVLHAEVDLARQSIAFPLAELQEQAEDVLWVVAGHLRVAVFAVGLDIKPLHPRDFGAFH